MSSSDEKENERKTYLQNKILYILYVIYTCVYNSKVILNIQRTKHRQSLWHTGLFNNMLYKYEMSHLNQFVQ